MKNGFKGLFKKAACLLIAGIMAATPFIGNVSVVSASKSSPDFTGRRLLYEVSCVYQMAHNGGYIYGDSNSRVPCADGVISCDRLASRALWNLGFTDQQSGGEVVTSLDSYLTSHGFIKIYDKNSLRAGDIVLVAENGSPDHCFIINSFTNAYNITKYDMGAQWRIEAAQPFTASLMEEGNPLWSSKYFYGAYRVPQININRASWDAVQTQFYTSSELKPAVSLHFGGMDLIYGVDYTLSYSSNSNVGIGYITVHGINDFNGTMTIPFAIMKTDFSSSMSSTISNGTEVSLLSAVNGNMTIDIAGGSYSNGANVQLYHSNKTDAQRFVIRQNTDNSVTIANSSTGLVLDCAGGGTANGTNVQQYMSNDTEAQKWNILDWGNGTVSFVNVKSGKALDVTGGNAVDFANVQIYEPNGSAAQRWAVTSVSGTSETSSQTIDTTKTYTLFSGVGYSKVLDISGGSTAARANVQIYQNNGTAAQKFTFSKDSSGYYTITNVKSGKVLDAQGGGTTDGTNVWQYNNNGTGAQKWIAKFHTDGSVSFINVNSGKALDVSGASHNNGANVQIYSYNNSSAQRWTLQ